VFEAKVSTFKDKILNGKYMAQFKNNKYEKKIIPNNLLSHFSNISTVEKKDFWGFTNNKLFRFIKISVKSLKLYNNLKYYLKTLEKEGFKAYESNIDPFLKYIHIQNIKPCGWVRIEKYEDGEDSCRCNYNISVNSKDIIPLDINKIAPILITSFDIECSSSHGDFPVAIKNYSKVAQDLALVAKAGYEYTSDFIISWLKNIYIKDIIIEDVIKYISVDGLNLI
jgi:DNA polymerase delta subunit 1